MHVHFINELVDGHGEKTHLVFARFIGAQIQLAGTDTFHYVVQCPDRPRQINADERAAQDRERRHGQRHFDKPSTQFHHSRKLFGRIDLNDQPTAHVRQRACRGPDQHVAVVQHVFEHAVLPFERESHRRTRRFERIRHEPIARLMPKRVEDGDLPRRELSHQEHLSGLTQAAVVPCHVEETCSIHHGFDVAHATVIEHQRRVIHPVDAAVGSLVVVPEQSAALVHTAERAALSTTGSRDQCTLDVIDGDAFNNRYATLRILDDPLDPSARVLRCARIDGNLVAQLRATLNETDRVHPCLADESEVLRPRRSQSIQLTRRDAAQHLRRRTIEESPEHQHAGKRRDYARKDKLGSNVHHRPRRCPEG